MENATSLHANPFWVLRVNSRDNGHRIVEQAEERALHIDHGVCQKARSDLTNPRSRLSAEMGWMPGVAPRTAEKFALALIENPTSARGAVGLPDLAQANLLAGSAELLIDTESAASIAQFIREFVVINERIDPGEVLRDINEDREISGFPKVTRLEAIDAELVERRKAYLRALKNLLDSMEPEKLVETLTMAVYDATLDGETQAPSMLDELVDTYEVEAQGFFDEESNSIRLLLKAMEQAVPQGEPEVAKLAGVLSKVVQNWNHVAKPIQLSMKSRGMVHRPSRDIAGDLRNLGVDLNNNHGMLDQADRMTRLLKEQFAVLPEMAEKVDEDAAAIARLRSQEQQNQNQKAQWEREINFRADVGLVFKDELSVSSSGVRWKGNGYPLDAITRVRWGGVRHSINGIPTGTDYTVAFGDKNSQMVVQLRNKSIYEGFLAAFWRAVCVRLMVETVNALQTGQTYATGNMTVKDDGVTLTKHNFLRANENVWLGWSDVQVWSADGSFVIGSKTDKKVYGSASYIDLWNIHLLEQIIRGTFKKGANNLSDYLKD